jgi:hypothetical protein
MGSENTAAPNFGLLELFRTRSWWVPLAAALGRQCDCRLRLETRARRIHSIDQVDVESVAIFIADELKGTGVF